MTTTKAPRALCPQCGRFNETHKTTVEPSGIWTVVYLCQGRRHQWMTKWLAGEVSE